MFKLMISRLNIDDLYGVPVQVKNPNNISDEMVCVNPVNAVDSYVLNKGDDDFSSPSTLVININNYEE